MPEDTVLNNVHTTKHNHEKNNHHVLIATLSALTINHNHFFNTRNNHC